MFTTASNKAVVAKARSSGIARPSLSSFKLGNKHSSSLRLASITAHAAAPSAGTMVDKAVLVDKVRGALWGRSGRGNALGLLWHTSTRWACMQASGPAMTANALQSQQRNC